MSARRWLLGTIVALSACDQGFSPPDRIDGPRVLAVITDPPAGPVGTHVRARATLAGMGESVTVRWWWCHPASGLVLDADGVGPSEDCLEAGTSSEQLGTTLETEFDIPDNYLAEVTAALQSVDGGTVDGGIPERVPLVLVVSADDGSGPTRAVKRFAVTLDGETAENPAFPVLRMRSGGIETVLREGNRGQCIAEAGRLVVVTAGATMSIEPEERSASCGLFTTDGSVLAGGGCGEWTWRAPATVGRVRQWFVVGDGNGGSAECAWDVEVR